MGRTRNDLAMFANLYLFRSGEIIAILIPKWRNHRIIVITLSTFTVLYIHSQSSIYIHNPYIHNPYIHSPCEFTVRLPSRSPSMTISNKNDITRTLQKPPISQLPTWRNYWQLPLGATTGNRNCVDMTTAELHAATAVASLLTSNRNEDRTATAAQILTSHRN